MGEENKFLISLLIFHKNTKLIILSVGEEKKHVPFKILLVGQRIKFTWDKLTGENLI